MGYFTAGIQYNHLFYLIPRPGPTHVRYVLSIYLFLFIYLFIYSLLLRYLYFSALVPIFRAVTTAKYAQNSHVGS